MIGNIVEKPRKNEGKPRTTKEHQEKPRKTKEKPRNTKEHQGKPRKT